jgi:LAO/AO transport system kinase
LTAAITGLGIRATAVVAELADVATFTISAYDRSAIRDHRAHLESTGELAPRRASRASDELVQILAVLLRERALAEAGDRLDAAAAEVTARSVDPWTAAERLLDGR